MYKWVLFSLPLVLNFLFPQVVFAHAFGQLYNLPVPFWLYLWGGAAAILISFLVVALFVGKGTAFGFKEKELEFPFLNFLKSTAAIFIFKSISLTLLLFTLATGLFGFDNPRFNFNMVFFWIYFVLGYTYLTAILGNTWKLINPIKVFVEVVEKLFPVRFAGFFKYPTFLGYTGAFFVYFAFIWLELLGETTPKSVSIILSEYILLTLVLSIVFGKEIVFKYIEFFEVFFSLIGKIAPIYYQNRKIYLRFPFSGLVYEQAAHISLLMFIIFMLSSTAFDGLKATIPYSVVSKSFFTPNTLTEVLLLDTIGLVLSFLLFLYIYLFLIGISKVIAKSKLSLVELSLKFAYSIVPVALAYNVAHYWTLLVTESQSMKRIISDPFGLGWDLFGTAFDKTTVTLVDPNIGWHSQVAVILLGHIVGVYLAHYVAVRTLGSKHATFSQLPMLLMMIIYTMAGLWILSQPITT